MSLLKNKEPLQTRFLRFCKTLPGAEIIDDLPLTPEQQQAKKADLFLAERGIICECKTLTMDMQPKIDAIMEPHRQRPYWPVFYGPWELEKILPYLPDGKAVRMTVFSALTAVIEDQIKEANRQIRATKETFHVPTAGGLLLILNDLVETLSPVDVGRRIAKTLRKRLQDGTHRFPHIDCVLMIAETHYVLMSGGRRGIPMHTYRAAVDPQRTAIVAAHIDTLLAAWAQFNQLPLAESTGPIEEYPVAKMSTLPDPKKPIMRHQFWQEQYRRRPYLRSLSDEEFAKFGKTALLELTPYFLKGGPKVPPAAIEPIMRRWTDFLTEVNHRGFDMRRLKIKESDVLPFLKQKQTPSE